MDVVERVFVERRIHDAVFSIRSDRVKVLRGESLFHRTRARGVLDDVTRRMSRTKGPDEGLGAQHVQVIMDRNRLRFEVEVGDMSVGVAASGDSHCAVFHTLDGLEGRGAQIWRPDGSSVVNAGFYVNFMGFQEGFLLATPTSAGQTIQNVDATSTLLDHFCGVGVEGKVCVEANAENLGIFVERDRRTPDEDLRMTF